MIRPKNLTEDSLSSITKNCGKLIEQTHRKAEETLEFTLTKSREPSHFNPPVQIKGDRMTGLTSLEVNNSIFNITEESNKFGLCTNNIEFSFEELKDELEEILSVSDSTPYHLQHEKTGPRIIEAYRKQIGKMKH